MWLSAALALLEIIRQVLALVGPEARLRRLEVTIERLRTRRAEAQARLAQENARIAQQPDLSAEQVAEELRKHLKRKP